MGNRISFSFKNGDEVSVAFFDHWAGEQLMETVKAYYQQLKKQLIERNSTFYPIERMEPCTVMVDFIRWFTKNMDIVQSTIYLGKDGKDGDNSDNGHYIFDLRTGEYYNELLNKI